MRGMKWAAVRPIWCPATDITNVIDPEQQGREPGRESGEAKGRAGGDVVDAQRQGQPARREPQVRIRMLG